MSDLETLTLIASLFVLLATWIPWYSQAATINPLALSSRIGLGLCLAPVVCLLFTLVILLTVAQKTSGATLLISLSNPAVETG